MAPYASPTALYGNLAGLLLNLLYSPFLIAGGHIQLARPSTCTANARMSGAISFLGFGEAAQCFAGAPSWRGAAQGFDIKTDAPAGRAAKLDDFARFGVTARAHCAGGVSGAPAVLSLVTADQALAAARAAAPHLDAGALYLDMNSVAPATKRAAAEAIEAQGGRYVDVAVMAPVHPAALAVPLLLSGAHAEAAIEVLSACGFTNARAVGAAIGRASQIKMVRSVLVKGIEALTVECVLAADAGGVLEEVLASLGGNWPQQANYNLERAMTHGVRRAAEMGEAAQTLRDLGVEPTMTLGTIARQRALGQMALTPAPNALAEKLARIRASTKADAA